MTERLQRAAAAAAGAGLTGLLIAPGPDLLHLIGHAPPVESERLTLLVVSDGREPTLLVPALERADAEGAPVALADWRDGEDPYAAAAGLLDPRGRYAVSDACWAAHVLGLQERLPDARFTALGTALPLLRAVKDADELERLARASAAADAVFADIAQTRFAGRREREVAADIGEALLAHGHDAVWFAVVGSGPNGANPHHGAGDREIAPGDLVVLDFGGPLDGYGSDITRTVAVGEPPERAREIYEVVRAAQQAAVEAVAPGVPCEAVDRAARAVIEDAGYGERFFHRTGHGIGVTGHEPPYIVAGESAPLEPGMVFSIEPGIYLSGELGVRIEDIVAVTDDGVRRLNNAPRELEVVQ
jgi:Xaa-Pro aminopeptidase